MKKIKKVTAIICVAAMTATFGTTALAAERAGREAKATYGTPRHATLTEEQKTSALDKIRTHLSEKLADGSITQEDYDAAIEKIDAGEFPQLQQDRKEKTDMEENGKFPRMMHGKYGKGAHGAALTDEAVTE